MCAGDLGHTFTALIILTEKPVLRFKTGLLCCIRREMNKFLFLVLVTSDYIGLKGNYQVTNFFLNSLIIILYLF